MRKELELIAHALADAADDGCFDNPPNFDDPKNPPSFSELDEWHSGEEDREWWMKLAKSSVSKLSEHGYSIVPAADVKSVRMVAEYALHLRVNGECAPGGDESWAKFDRFAEAVLRATGPAAAAAEEDRQQTDVERLFQQHLDNENPDLKRHMQTAATEGGQ